MWYTRARVPLYSAAREQAAGELLKGGTLSGNCVGRSPAYSSHRRSRWSRTYTTATSLRTTRRRRKSLTWPQEESQTGKPDSLSHHYNTLYTSTMLYNPLCPLYTHCKLTESLRRSIIRVPPLSLLLLESCVYLLYYQHTHTQLMCGALLDLTWHHLVKVPHRKICTTLLLLLLHIIAKG